MNLHRFLRNMEQTIFEGMAKIGYLKGKPSQVYYDKRLLGFLLEVDLKDLEEGYALLTQAKDSIQKDYPDLRFHKEESRICFWIGPDTMEEIHQRNKNNSFLISLVSLMSTRNASLEQVIGVFESSEKEYEMEEVNNPEFSHIFHFLDTSFDEYFYCFYFDEMGSYYHRLLAFELVE